MPDGDLFILQKYFFYLKLPQKSMHHSTLENMLFVDLHLYPSIAFGQILVSNKVLFRTQNQEKVELLALAGVCNFEVVLNSTCPQCNDKKFQVILSTE